MRKLLLTVAAAAILTPLGAAADEKNKTEIGVKAQHQADQSQHKMGAKMRHDAKANLYLEPTQLSAKDFLGEGIHGVEGDRIARVDDIVIGADGKAKSVVFLSGGVFGLGGKRGALDFNRVNVSWDSDYDPRVQVSLTQDAIQSVAEYNTDKMNDYQLASEIIGTKVDLASRDDSDDDAVINDIILDKDGSVKFLVVQKSMLGSIGAGQKYAVDYSRLSHEQGDGGLVLNVTEKDLEKAAKFSHMRRQAADVRKEMHDTMHDAADKAEDAADDVEDSIDH